ncbi:MAG TPA: DUF2520 domain-containing protein [Candidatus Dormibacteraeota bacterium]|nr:DUF2520 domain-containing protein [Candidatus Dormibacteraeota bacterium]
MERTLSVVGAGRAGAALAIAAHERGWRIAAVASRDQSHAQQLAAATDATAVRTAAQAATQAALTILAVPESQVVRVAATIAANGVALRNRIIAHCSASLGTDVLASLRENAASVGVVHPLQALSGDHSADLLDGSYFRVEGDAHALQTINTFVHDLGGIQLHIAPEHRALYHAAAVLAGNAPLTLLARATALLVDAGVEPGTAHAALATLLEGSARNARRSGAAAALTGPVARGDAATVQANLDALAADPAARELYLTLAREMLALAGTSGRERVAHTLDAAEHATRPRLAHPRVA